MSRDELSTTAYAILGLLAIKPWTTYELAQQMDRALGLFWPRARSHLYAEPKRLVAHGLATATEERTGQRPRTVYAITPAGREALAAWAGRAGAGPSIEFEALVKVFFAEHLTKEALLEHLDGVRRWVEERSDVGSSPAREYRDGAGPYPERLPWLLLAGRFLHNFEVMVDEWAAWAIGEVERWPDDLRGAEPDWASLERMADFADELHRRAALRRDETGGGDARPSS